jgi:hypothetical protein
MAFFPGYSSISPIFCPFCSPSLCFCFLSQEQRPVLRDFHSSDQDKLFSNLIAQFVGCTTIEQIIPVYTPSSDGNDVQGHIAALLQAAQTWRAGGIVV